MIQSNKRANISVEPKRMSQEARQEALLDLARLMVQANRDWITQMEYDLTPDKAYTVQFFIRHWGSWAQAVQQARPLMVLQKNLAPKPSPFAGYVQCLCGKALHCKGRFWSADRRKIRMCDPCRAWSEGVTVDEALLYMTDDSASGRSLASRASRTQPAKRVKSQKSKQVRVG